ncbi:MAG: hypothetical protein OMM_00124 [Candidatus Magnetoglobus multicellularis str. Araruama]|uniref:Prepilin-type N-terminal cleavage/methylation domain-containing protein n=1 Tax=Candidatus Magnetoglobus multicellularis str. Araruama TaxID=890399 RepID=A0A1V1PI08_9BACT|nr:MAG: hypothetical protein OMM_00124 [Candidatus Magnetoglobus multicellularis str. Araruama]
MKRYRSNNGFTLIEIIVTLMLIALISGLAGISLMNYIDAYSLQQQNADVVQEARMVINRLLNEFIHITEVHQGTSDEIAFRSRFNNESDTTITYKNNSITINDVPFVDNVGHFNLRYLTSVTCFDDVERRKMWGDTWKDDISTAIQFDISFQIFPILPQYTNKKRTHSKTEKAISFTNITVVPRTLKKKK